MIRNYYPNYAQKLEKNAETVFKDDMQNRVNYLFWFIEAYENIEISNHPLPDDLGIGEFNQDSQLFEEKVNNIRKQRCALLRIKPDAAVNDAENFTLAGCTLPEVEFWAVLKIKATHSKQFV